MKLWNTLWNYQYLGFWNSSHFKIISIQGNIRSLGAGGELANIFFQRLVAMWMWGCLKFLNVSLIGNLVLVRVTGNKEKKYIENNHSTKFFKHSSGHFTDNKFSCQITLIDDDFFAIYVVKQNYNCHIFWSIYSLIARISAKYLSFHPMHFFIAITWTQ
jgi:hypothetical protein